MSMKRMIFILLLVAVMLPAMAQDMKTVFVSMPDSITPLLTKVNREDCIDFLASNMKAEVRNRFGNVAEMKALTGDYVLMQTTPHSTLEMRLLPVNDSTKVVCMVKTVCASACDSEVRFFDTSWKEELDVSEYLQLPEAGEFFVQGDSVAQENGLIRKKADMTLMKASLSPDEATLTFEYTTPAYLSEEDREKLQPFLRKEPVVYRWEGGRFVK